MTTLSLCSISGGGHPLALSTFSDSSISIFSPKSKKPRRRRRASPLTAALVEATRISSHSSSNNGAIVPILDSYSIPSSSRDRTEDMQAEARAMARAANASVYSPQLLSMKYGSRPFKVLRRAFRILSGVGSFAFTLWVDQLQGQLDQRRRLRAVELRNILTGLGPTFVKIGQGLSTRPDLCPPEYLEELSELQVPFFLLIFMYVLSLKSNFGLLLYCK